MSEVRIKVTPKVLTVKLVALRGLPAAPTQEQINTAVTEYMDDHPEAQIPDGSVSMNKLSSDVAENVSDVPNKADQIGSYPDLIAGTADNLLSSSYQTDKTPYLLRRTHYGVRERGSIVGGSVVWNQLLDKNVYPATQTINGVTFTNNGDGTITVNGTATAQAEYSLVSQFPLPYGHKVLMMGCPSGGSASTYALLDNYQSHVVRDVGNGIIYSINTTSNRATAKIRVLSGVTVSNLVFKPQTIDLTLMFGPTIADYIYAQEQATAGAGVVLAKAWAGITADYYPYDAGSIKSVTGLTAHKMTGKNIFGGDALKDGIKASMPSAVVDETGKTVKFNSNATVTQPIVEGIFAENTRYTFIFTLVKDNTATSSNIKITYTDGTTSAITITSAINEKQTVRTISTEGKTVASLGKSYQSGSTTIYYEESGIFTGAYGLDVFEPYTAHEYPLDSSLTLRGLPKLDGDNLYYDGDVYKADGTVERRYGIVDLGTMNWSYAGNKYFQSNSIANLILKPAQSVAANFVCPMYTPVAWSDTSAKSGDMAVNNNGTLSCINPAYTDATAFKTAMSGVYLVYELATPTTETAEPYTELQICYPAGTEEWVGASMPVGHETKYYADLKGKIEDIPDAPSADGTYTLKVTVSGGVATYSWE